MSKSIRSLMIATAAASLFLTGCATQGTTDNTQPVAGSTVTTTDVGMTKTVASCKGMSSCKGRASCKAKKKVKKVAKKVKKEVKTDGQ